MLVLGLLGGLEVATGGFAFPVRRAPVGGDVTESFRDRQLVDLGGPLVRGAGFEVAMTLAAVGLLVALMRMLGALAGTLDVIVGDGFPGSDLPAPAQELVGAFGGFITR